MAKTLGDFASKLGIESGEWRSLTGNSWTLEGCREMVVGKIRRHIETVVLGTEPAPRNPITRPSSGGTMVKVTYGRATLVAGELKTRANSKVAEVLSGIADSIEAGEFDKELEAAYADSRAKLVPNK